MNGYRNTAAGAVNLWNPRSNITILVAVIWDAARYIT